MRRKGAGRAMLPIAMALAVGGAWTLSAFRLPTPFLIDQWPHETFRYRADAEGEAMEYNVHRPFSSFFEDPIALESYQDDLSTRPNVFAFLPKDPASPVKRIVLRPGRVLYRPSSGAEIRARRQRAVEAIRRWMNSDEPVLAHDVQESDRIFAIPSPSLRWSKRLR